MGPSTSKGAEMPLRSQTSDAKLKTEVDSGDTAEDSDAGNFCLLIHLSTFSL